MIGQSPMPPSASNTQVDGSGTNPASVPPLSVTGFVPVAEPVVPLLARNVPPEIVVPPLYKLARPKLTVPPMTETPTDPVAPSPMDVVFTLIDPGPVKATVFSPAPAPVIPPVMFKAFDPVVVTCDMVKFLLTVTKPENVELLSVLPPIV